MTPATQQQPEPRPGGVSVTDLVLADLPQFVTPRLQAKLAEAFEARRQFGISKYGRELTTENGRDPLVDAFQEGLDKSKYYRQAMERSEFQHLRRQLDRLYRMELIALEEMAEMLHERERP